MPKLHNKASLRRENGGRESPGAGPEIGPRVAHRQTGLVLDAKAVVVVLDKDSHDFVGLNIFDAKPLDEIGGGVRITRPGVVRALNERPVCFGEARAGCVRHRGNRPAQTPKEPRSRHKLDLWPASKKMSENRCYCFPRPEEICKVYSEQSEDKYLAEKTCRTVRFWLGGKNLSSFSSVPNRAVNDFQQYICTGSAVDTCIAVAMNADINHERISRALKKMAVPCACADVPKSVD